MFKQIIKKTGFLLSVVAILSTGFVASYPSVARAQSGYIMWCVTGCVGYCEAIGYCLWSDGGSSQIALGYHAECCF